MTTQSGSEKLTFNDVKHAMDVLSKIPPEGRNELMRNVDKYRAGSLKGEELEEVITKCY